MRRLAIVEFTLNVERNLEDVERFLADHEASATFQALLTDLFDVVIPNLRRFPAIGADFLARRPQSAQAAAKIDRLRGSLEGAATVREYVAGDYLLLYATGDDHVWLLSIRHHNQLSYDLKSHWTR